MARLIVSVIVGAEPDLVLKCVGSLLVAAGRTLDVRVRVTCNAANPAVAKQLAARFPGIALSENVVPTGFAANHNAALADADGDYLLLANDDLEFQSDAVERSIEFLERHENSRVGSLSPRLLNPDGSLQRSTYGFPTVPRALLDLSGLRARIPHNRWTDRVASWLGYDAGRSRFWAHDRTCDVDTFRGAAMFVRAATWREVGRLSERTRVGGEIAEWHRRCRNDGWRVVFFSDATVIHYGSRTVGRDRLLRSEYLKGYLVYFALHRSGITWWCFRGGAFVVALLRLALAALSGDRIGTRLWRTNVSILLAPPRPTVHAKSPAGGAA